MVVSGQAVQMNRGIARELTDILEGLAVQQEPQMRPKASISLASHGHGAVVSSFPVLAAIPGGVGGAIGVSVRRGVDESPHGDG